ncbi:MAG: hypothetical protein IT439_03725 [Phycisphaerales bacterium]|nr:hypothetical protein [Phycisphaerales bacterium]
MSVLRRVFGEGQNPMEWAIPLYALWGIRVRLHIIFAIYIVSELLIAGIKFDATGWSLVAVQAALLFVLVLLHEYGHCLACRAVRGEADQILMWPLGGLAFCRPPHGWKPELVTVIGGPLVNVILLPMLGGGLLLVTGEIRSVVYNPFDAAGAMVFVRTGDGLLPYWLMVLWMAYHANLALLAFNMLVPMYPMDCGRIVQCLLWARLGYEKSLHIATTVGLVAAGTLVILGMLTNQSMLLVIGLFGGFTCWAEKQRLRMGGGAEFGPSWRGEPIRAERAPRPSKRHLREQAREAAAHAEIDRILDKIRAEGIGGLSKSEKKTLERASRRDGAA